MTFDTTDYNDVSYAQSTLAQHWGDEWDALSGVQQVAVLTDFTSMIANEGWDSVHDACAEYQERIFVGNLLSYVNTLEVRR